MARRPSAVPHEDRYYADLLGLYNELLDQVTELVEQGDVASARSLLARARRVGNAYYLR